VTEPSYRIKGGAEPDVAAAIGAVISMLLDGELSARSHPAKRPKQSPWVLAWRPRETPSPLPSHTYDATGWSEAAEPEDEAR
jgi:hypothetical protein